MKSTTKQLLTVLHIVSWVFFVGLCIKTGAILYSYFVSVVINPEGAKNLHMGLDLSNLYAFDKGHYSTMVIFIIALSAFKACIFFLLVKIFLKLNLVSPFSTEISAFITRIGFVALWIGVLTLFANGYCDWLSKRGVVFPTLQAYVGAGAEFLLMGGIIFIISQIFKRGIEIQSENELTV